MKSMNSRLAHMVVLAFLSNSFFIMNGFGQPNARNEYEAYYLHINTYPSGAVSWGEDQREVQGITHDDANWYITATHRSGWADFDIDNCFLWKISVKEDLNRNVDSNPNVTLVNLYQLSPLWNGSDPLTGYIHWGDVDHYKDSKGISYLVVPVTSPSLPSPALVIFRTADLSIACLAILRGGPGNPQTDVGWCAVNPLTGYLYTSNDSTTTILRYEVPWEQLPTSGYFVNFPVTYKESYELRDVATGAVLELHNMQGGEFTESGELLYVSNGRGRCKGKGAPDPGHPNDGINVFDTKTWQRIKQSTNRCYGGPGVSDCDHPRTDYFDFTYDFGCGLTEAHSDQPQGLTIWDLDDGRSPYVSGQLHVLTAAVGLAGNMATLEHFTRKIYVDDANGSVPEWVSPLPGTSSRPFKTVGDAFNWYPAWAGAEIMLGTGSYPETGTFSQRVLLNSQGGAVIGVSGTVSGVRLFEHANYQGDSRFFTSDVSDLHVGIVNFGDVTSSVQLVNLEGVRLYVDSNYGEPVISITQNTPDLASLGWNDKVSSLRITP